jgi:FtsP/CotA-like multicopper oxidase with cupredoxin domain
MVIVEPNNDPGRYDLEVPVILHEWEGFFSAEMDVDYRVFTINGRMLGAGEPLRVKTSQRALFRVLNASATAHHRVALSGHTFRVVSLDGNPVATPQIVPVLELAPGERVDALVEMNNPGTWVLGEEDDRQRNGGAGIVVEYAGAPGRLNAHVRPKWITPPGHAWDYLAFAAAAANPRNETRQAPAAIVPLVFEPRSDGNLWAINGKSYPRAEPFFVRPGVLNRLIFDNRSHMAHPVHLHRHTFEIVNYAGRPAAGVFKDVVVVPAMSQVHVDLMANQPGPSLFHCHQQFHMDFGFMAIMQYSGG